MPRGDHLLRLPTEELRRRRNNAFQDYTKFHEKYGPRHPKTIAASEKFYRADDRLTKHLMETLRDEHSQN